MKKRTSATSTKTAFVSEQAREIFLSDSDYIEIFDVEHSDEEDRFLAVEAIRDGVAVVVSTEREDETIRIISARWATRKEPRSFQSCLDGVQ